MKSHVLLPASTSFPSSARLVLAVALTLLTGSAMRVSARPSLDGYSRIGEASDGLTRTSAELWSQDGRAEAVAPVPELFVQSRHSSGIGSIAMSPDGTVFASASSDRTVRVWETMTGTLQRVLRHPASVNSVAFAPDGKRLVTGADDGMVRVWGAGQDSPLVSIPCTTAVAEVAVSPDGKLLSAVDIEGRVGVWRLDGHPVASAQPETAHRTSVSSKLVFSHDGSQVVFTEDVGAWILTLAGKLTQLDLLASMVAVSPVENRIAIAGPSANCRITVSKSGESPPAASQWTLVGPPQCSSLAFSADGRFFAAGGDGQVKIWTVADGKQALRVDRPEGGEVVANRISGLALSPDGRQLVTGDAIGTLSQIRVPSGEAIRILQASRGVGGISYGADGTLWTFTDGQAVVLHRNGEVRTVAYESGPLGAYFFTLRPSQDTFAVTAMVGNADLIDSASGSESGATERGHLMFINGVAFSPTGTLLATAGCDGKVLLSSADGAFVKEFQDTDCAQSVAISRDDTELIAGYGGGRAYETLTLSDSATKRHEAIVAWDVASGRPRLEIPIQSGTVREVVLSPNDLTIAACSDRAGVQVFERRTGRLLFTGGPHPCISASFGSDSRTLAVALADAPRIDIWNVGTGALLGSLSPPAPARKIVVSPDGHQLASTDGDGVLIWNLSNFTQVATLVPGQRDSVDSFLIELPTGYYFGRNDAGLVSFRLDGRILPFDMFDVRFNRPDEVLKQLGVGEAQLIGLYRAAYLRRLRTLKLTEPGVLRPRPLPALVALKRDGPSGQLNLSVRAAESVGTLAALRVTVNGVPASGMHPVPSGAKAFNDAISIRLSPGRNYVQVSATNDQGAESPRITFDEWNEVPGWKPRLVVLAVGVSDYADSAAHLQYAGADATAVGDLFQSSRDGFASVRPVVLTGPGANRAAILTALDNLRTAGEDDEVVVFLAGHGVLDSKLDYFFAPADMDFADPAKHGLSIDDIERALSAVPSRRKVLLMDTCHAGEIDRADVQVSATADPTVGRTVQRSVRLTTRALGGAQLTPMSSLAYVGEVFADLRQSTGTQIVAASAGAEFSFEADKWGHGVFTFALLEGVRTGLADANRDGSTSLAELRRYVALRVQALTDGQQHPMSRGGDLEGDFSVAGPAGLKVIGHHAHAVREAAFSPDGQTAVTLSDDRVQAWSVETGTSTTWPLGVRLDSVAFRDRSAFELAGGSINSWLVAGTLEGSTLGTQQTAALNDFNGWPAKTVTLSSGAQARQATVARGLTLSANGRWAAVDVDGKVTLLDLSDRLATTLPIDLGNDGGVLALSADGAWLAIAPRRDHEVLLFDVRAGKTRGSVTIGAKDVSAMAFSGDSQRLGVGCADNRALLFDNTPHLLRTSGQASARDSVTAVAFTADDKTMIVASSDGTVAFDPIGAEGPIRFMWNGSPVRSVAMSPDAKTMVTGGEDGSVRLWRTDEMADPLNEFHLPVFPPGHRK